MNGDRQDGLTAAGSVPSADEDLRTSGTPEDVPWVVVGWSTAWFFFVLLSYSMVRPVRETMGAIGGTRQLQGLMLATFLIMLAAVPIYSLLVNHLSRRWLVRAVFHFFSISLIGFSLALSVGGESMRLWAGRAFFLWVNVFALYSTSVFWSVMADILSSGQGKRLFGRIAAGGTVGAITGSLLTSQVAVQVSTATLLWFPVVSIQAGLWCAWRLERNAGRSTVDASTVGGDGQDEAIGHGGLLEGITHVLQSPYLAMICVFLFFVQAAGTQLYFQQAEIVAATVPDDQEKTQVFAYIDFSTQALTLIAQLLLSATILRRGGVGMALAILPLMYIVSFIALSMFGSLGVVAVAMVATRGTAYGITVPAREVLFTVVSREDKYKSKSFIDTVVLRGGDAITGQLFGSLRNVFGISLPVLNLCAIPLALCWVGVAYRLGKRQRRRAGLSLSADAE